MAGNLVEVVGIAVGVMAIALANKVPAPTNFLMLLLAWLCFWYFSHCLSHYVVGRLVGARFRHYMVGPSSIIRLNLPFVTTMARLIPTLGLRIDHDAFKRLPPRRRAAVYASGALASMFSPLIAVAASFKYSLAVTALILAVITVANILFTAYYSPKAGDFKRALDALRVK